MRVEICANAYLVTMTGILRASEVNPGDRILGVDKKGKDTFLETVKASKPTMCRSLRTIFTDKGVVRVGREQPVWTDEGIKIPDDMDEALKNTYEGTKLDTRTSHNRSFVGDSNDTDDITHENAYTMGVLTRRIQGEKGGLVIRVPKNSPVWSEDSLARIASSKYVTDAVPKMKEGLYWDWILFQPTSSGKKELPRWEPTKTVPLEIRTSDNRLIKEFTFGCIDVRLDENLAVFGFGEQDLLRFCCMSLSFAASHEFLLRLSPNYAPCEFMIDLSDDGLARVRSIIPSSGKRVVVEFEDAIWAPYVNVFLLQPL